MKNLLAVLFHIAPYFLLGPATRYAPNILLLILLLVTTPAAALTPDALTRAAPDLSPAVAERAALAISCMEAHSGPPSRLIVVDMSRHANDKRLWAFDVSNPQTAELLLTDWVAHGAGSDPNRDGLPERFSNRVNSHMTSLGAYRIGERYFGRNGWSRRLDGLMDGLNSRARDRAVVMHPSSYVRPGSVGRSQGCPAVRQEVMSMLEREGLDDALLWIDADDAALSMALEHCRSERLRMQPAWGDATRSCRSPSPFSDAG